jgi:hypothetical protein
MNISKITQWSAVLPLLVLCSGGGQADVVHPQRPVPVTVVYLPFAPVDDAIGTQGEAPTTLLITNTTQYQQLFGEDATGIDFNSEWAFFSSAGLEPTDGYDLGVQQITYTPAVKSLVISTMFTSPGLGCGVAQHVTKPYTLVRFPHPPGHVNVVRVDQEYQTVDCLDR